MPREGIEGSSIPRDAFTFHAMTAFPTRVGRRIRGC